MVKSILVLIGSLAVVFGLPYYHAIQALFTIQF
jgi:hypothetical protein